MTRLKIAFYIALIFIAGGVAGAGIHSAWKPEERPRQPARSREDFANHIFNRMKERLELTPEQITTVEPVFRRGIEEVRAIQDRSVKEVRAAIRKNHEEIGGLLTPEQRDKLERWDQERDKEFREHRSRRYKSGKDSKAREAAELPTNSLPPGAPAANP